jgi:hypothetical protein
VRRPRVSRPTANEPQKKTRPPRSPVAMSSVVLATAGYDHTIRFWEATSGICYRTLQYADSQVNRLEITAEKSLVAAAGYGQIRLYEVNSNDAQPVFSYDGHVGNVTAVGFQKDSKWLFSGRVFFSPSVPSRARGAVPSCPAPSSCLAKEASERERPRSKPRINQHQHQPTNQNTTKTPQPKTTTENQTRLLNQNL